MTGPGAAVAVAPTRLRTRVLPAAARRSAALRALPVMVGLVVANILARDRAWAHEWLWAHYQYAFVTVLLGPLVAGIGAWDGVRLARARTLLGTTDRTLRALVVAWLAAACWVLAAYAVGLVVVTGLVKGAGTPGWPSPLAWRASVPGAALLVAETAAGVAVGWWLRHPLAAPAACLGCFVTTLWLYVSGPGGLVVVGGATASMFGETPRAGYQAWQVVWFLVVGPVLLVAAARTSGWGPRPGRWQLPVTGCLGVAVLVALLAQGEVVLERSGEAVVCVGTAPEVCVAPGYADQAEATRDALLPYLAALTRIGVTPPRAFSQDAEPGQGDVGPLDSTLILARDPRPVSAVTNAFLSKACPFDEHVMAAFDGLSWWLVATATGDRTGDPTVPAVVTGPPSAAQAAWLREAVATLRSCGR